MQQITCSFIALAFDIHIFCLCAEAEGAILHTMKKVEECSQSLTFHVLVGFCSAGSQVHITKINVGGSVTLNGFDPRNDLVLGGIRIGHGLHESSYHYFKVYAGTFNLNISISIEQKRKLRN